MLKRIALLCLIAVSNLALAQVEVTVHPKQIALLTSEDPKLAANKKLVYDFWVKVFQARNGTLIQNMFAESYIQHNPNVPTGRAALTKFIKGFPESNELPLTTIPDLVMISAERDIVTLAFRVERPHPKNAEETYTTTWFDMFRIENGRIAEHWDSAPIW
jgi:predicted SnoaL-like aldol condensation-catalyzing enzyme